MIDEQPPAAWELAVSAGIDLALVPTDDWLDALEDAAPNDVGPCVYFIQQVGTPCVKIGVSRALWIGERLSQLQIGNPNQLEVRRLVQGDANVEAVLHAAFADLRIRGEWFSADRRLADLGRLEP